MMPEEQATDVEDRARQPEIAKGIDVDCIRILRRARLAEAAEKSLHWLIPAATLAYLVFRIIPLLGS